MNLFRKNWHAVPRCWWTEQFFQKAGFLFIDVGGQRIHLTAHDENGHNVDVSNANLLMYTHCDRPCSMDGVRTLCHCSTFNFVAQWL